MIALAADCLLFELGGGGSYPFSAEMISVEVVGEGAEAFDEEFVTHASHAVFHYFKHEAHRESVTVAEFASALEKVLHAFPPSPDILKQPQTHMIDWDLRTLALQSCKGCELFFFPKLREELLRQLDSRPRLVRFRGLRDCVKELLGARRWTSRCEQLKSEIIEFLRHCLCSKIGQGEIAMVVS